jgi:hypothetical protein
MHALGGYLTIQGPFGIKEPNNLTRRDRDELRRAGLKLIDAVGDAFQLSRPDATSSLRGWLKRSAFLFLVGLSMALLAATEHLWTWSKYIAMLVE